MAIREKGSLATTVTVSRLPDASGNWVCDGTADDVEINEALGYVNTLGGGRVVLKQGTFTLANPIVFPGNNIWLRGMGRSTFIDGDALTTGNHAIELTSRTGCAIKKLAMQTEDGGLKTSHCIFVEDGCDNLSIHDVTIVDSDSDGVHIEGTQHLYINIRGLRVDDVDDSGISVDMDGANFCMGLLIEGCTIIGAGVMGIRLLECRYSNITNNIVSSSTQSGIVIDDGCTYCNLSNNISVLNTQHGILVATTATHIEVEGCVVCLNVRHGVYLNGVFDSLISNCLCQGNDSGDTGTYDGINLDTSSERNNVIGNHCCDNDRYGISVEDKQNNVMGNYVYNNGGHGISISGTECKITGNYVTDNSVETAGTHYGILLATTADRCQVSDNYCSDTGGDTQSDGIYITAGAIEVMINNNYCYNGYASASAGNGITLAGDNLDCQIVGNHCNQNDGDGIYVFNESQRCVVTGNKCMENGGHGIYVGQSNHCVISGNACNTNGADGINVTGDGTHNADYNNLTGNVCNANGDDGIDLEGAGNANNNIIVANQLYDNTGTNLVNTATDTELGHNQTAA